jgi:GMP synthase-like glutamine amidotransferase
MRTLVLQHTPEEKPGTLVQWLELRRLPHHVHHVYKDAAIPEDYELLVILGGPMNVDEEEKHPWLRAEKEFLRAWLAKSKPILGICLGGQMLAQALGAKVIKNSHREIGFHPLRRTGEEHPAFSRWPEEFHVFQWHEDRFELPPGCKALLTNHVTAYQAFARDHRTLGLQFHPESTEEWIRENFQGFRKTEPEPYVQDSEQCLHLLPQHLPKMTSQFFHFLDDFLASLR